MRALATGTEPGVQDVVAVEEVEDDAREEDEDEEESERILLLTLSRGKQLHLCADESR